jgi:hypothetical protein
MVCKHDRAYTLVVRCSHHHSILIDPLLSGIAQTAWTKFQANA